MGIWDRFASTLRDGQEPAGPARGPKNLANYSLAERLNLTRLNDDGLLAELERRRRARGRPGNRRIAGEDELDALHQARRSRIRELPLPRAYRGLELGPGARKSEVERAYRILLRRFHPDRHLGDTEKHQSSIALLTSLTDAYVAILLSLDKR